MSEVTGDPDRPAGATAGAPPDSPPHPPSRFGDGADRLPPHLGGAVGAAGGLVFAFGVVALIGEVPDSATRALGIVLGAALLAGAVIAARALPERPMLTAAAAASAVAVLPITALIVFDPDEPSLDTGDVTLFLILVAVGWGLLYFLAAAGGATVHLGLALAAIWLVALVQTFPSLDEVSPFGFFGPGSVEILPPDGFGGDAPSDGFEEGFGDGFDEGFEEDFGDGFAQPDDSDPDQFIEPEGDVSIGSDPFDTGDAGAVSLLFGALFVGAGTILDGRPRRAPATAFFAVGVVALSFGVGWLGQDIGAAGGGFLALGVGLVLAWVGAGGGRRFTTWTGGLLVLGGVVTLVDEITDDNALAAALVLLVAGSVVVWLAVLAGRRVDTDGGPGEPGPPPEPAQTPAS